jgi:hypothetical protein
MVHTTGPHAGFLTALERSLTERAALGEDRASERSR